MPTSAFAAMMTIAAALLLGPSSVAEAASAQCRKLDAQLANLERPRASKQQKSYKAAINKQRRQLALARKSARKDGCVGFRLFNRNTASAKGCSRSKALIKRMTANLSKLERRHAKLSRGNNVSAKRKRILAEIRSRGCRDQRRIRTLEANAQRDFKLRDKLFSGDLRKKQKAKARRKQKVAAAPALGLRGSGTYRTMCVRTCDGYYFPISFSTTEDLFPRDQKACEMMCPGTEVRLYSHRIPEEEPEEMVSVVGVPYTELPAAFRYRDPNAAKIKGCGCGTVAAIDYTILSGNYEKAEADPFASTVNPASRPDPGLDPETLASAGGGLTPATIRLIMTSKPATLGADAFTGRKVRVVGPAFLPDPPRAEVQPVPGQSEVR